MSRDFEMASPRPGYFHFLSISCPPGSGTFQGNPGPAQPAGRPAGPPGCLAGRPAGLSKSGRLFKSGPALQIWLRNWPSRGHAKAQESARRNSPGLDVIPGVADVILVVQMRHGWHPRNYVQPWGITSGGSELRRGFHGIFRNSQNPARMFQGFANISRGGSARPAARPARRAAWLAGDGPGRAETRQKCTEMCRNVWARSGNVRKCAEMCKNRRLCRGGQKPPRNVLEMCRNVRAVRKPARNVRKCVEMFGQDLEMFGNVQKCAEIAECAGAARNRPEMCRK